MAFLTTSKVATTQLTCQWGWEGSSQCRQIDTPGGGGGRHTETLLLAIMAFYVKTCTEAEIVQKSKFVTRMCVMPDFQHKPH